MRKLILGLLFLVPSFVLAGEPVNLYDAKGNAITSTAGALNINGSITATNPSVGTNASTAPTSSTELGFILSGNLVGVSAANPLPISGSITATNPSVGVNATTAPTSSTQMGFLSSGNLVNVSSSNPLPITGTISASNPSVGATGSAVPSSATYLGASNGTNLTGLLTGQQTMANSLACVLPSNQSAIPVTESGTWTVQPGNTANTTAWLVTGTGGTFPITATSLPLPTGAATSALQTATQGTVAAGTAATASTMVGGIFNTTLPTLTTGQQAAIQLDSSGRQILGTSSATIGTVNQGTANTVANAWTSKITDGTNTGVVKAASTAAVATDPALVVALSPNNNTLTNALFTKNTDGTNIAAVKAASTAAVATDPALVVAISPNNGIAFTPAVTGSGSAAAATVSTVVTLTAPTNATGFILQCLDTSTANIRWAVGRTATTTLGQQLQPGRDTGFVPIGANVSIVAESGTQNYDIQWIAK